MGLCNKKSSFFVCWYDYQVFFYQLVMVVPLKMKGQLSEKQQIMVKNQGQKPNFLGTKTQLLDPS